jgi:hypothetical protein
MSLRSGKLVGLQDLNPDPDPDDGHSIVAIEARGGSEVLLSVMYSARLVPHLLSTNVNQE